MVLTEFTSAGSIPFNSLKSSKTTHNIIFLDLNGCCTISSLASSSVAASGYKPLVWSPQLLRKMVYTAVRKQAEVFPPPAAAVSFLWMSVLPVQSQQNSGTLLWDSYIDVEVLHKHIKYIWIPSFLHLWRHVFLAECPETNTPGCCHHCCIHQARTAALISPPFVFVCLLSARLPETRWPCLRFNAPVVQCNISNV